MEIYSIERRRLRRAPAHTTPRTRWRTVLLPDGKQIVFLGRAEEGTELKNFLGLLKEGLWRPTLLESS